MTEEPPNGRATSPKRAELPVQVQGRAGQTPCSSRRELCTVILYLGMYPRSGYVYTEGAYGVCLRTTVVNCGRLGVEFKGAVLQLRAVNEITPTLVRI